MRTLATFRRTAFLMLLAACSSVSEIPNDSPVAPAPGTALTDGATPSSSATLAAYDGDCRDITVTSAGRACRQRPLTTPQTGPDASAYFATGAQTAAERNALTQNQNQADFLRNSPQLGGAGDAAALSRQRIMLEQNSSRLARDRLRTAPYSRTVGSINQ